MPAFRLTGPAAAWLATRTALVLVAWGALALVPLELGPGQWRDFPGQPWIDGWARWDSAWYRSVFELGYDYVPGRESNVNFFPLQPALAGALSLPLRGWLGPERSFHAAAIALSHACALLAVLGLHDLARVRVGRAAADRAAWLLCLYPFSFYLAAAYSEALFLALAIGAFRLADRERWLAACALAAVAAVARVPGFLVAVGLAALYLERRGPDPRGWGREAWAFLATPAPLLAFMAWLGVRFGDPLVFVTTQQESWGRSLGIDLGHQWSLLVDGGLSWPGACVTGWRVALTVALPFAVWLTWRRLGAALGLYTLLALLLPIVSGIQALERYALAAFPAFIALGAALRGRAAFLAVCAFCAPWLLLFAAWVARWEPMVSVPR